MDDSSCLQKIIIFILLICLINIMVIILNKQNNQNRIIYGSGEISLNAVIYCTSFDGKDFLRCQEMILKYMLLHLCWPNLLMRNCYLE